MHFFYNMHVYYGKIENLKSRRKNKQFPISLPPKIANDKIVVNIFPGNFPGVPIILGWKLFPCNQTMEDWWSVVSEEVTWGYGELVMDSRVLAHLPSILYWFELICHLGSKRWVMLTSFALTLWLLSLEHTSMLLVSWFPSALCVAEGACQSSGAC